MDPLSVYPSVLSMPFSGSLFVRPPAGKNGLKWGTWKSFLESLPPPSRASLRVQGSQRQRLLGQPGVMAMTAHRPVMLCLVTLAWSISALLFEQKD